MKIFNKESAKKAQSYAIKHKFLSACAFLLIVGVGYWTIGSITGNNGNSTYALAAVEKGTLITSVSGTGQISASNKVEIKSKVSGDVLYVGIKNGDYIRRGTLIAQIDSTDAQKAVRDAQTNLETTKLSYEKVVEPATNLEIMQAENALEQAKTNLEKSYDDGFNSVSNAFGDLPTVMSDLNTVLFGTSVSRDNGQTNAAAYADMVKTYNNSVLVFKENAELKYSTAKNKYDENFLKYRNASRTSESTEIKNLILETYTTSKSIADAVKSASDLLAFVKEELTEKDIPVPASLTTYQSTLSSASSKINSHLSSLLSIKNSIPSSEYSILEKTESLAELKNGADKFDVRSAQISINQKEDALLDAKENLSNYYVVAPFDGSIASLEVRANDSISNGTSIATIITKQKIAEISLNEVDIAQVKVGQKVTLTFDAIEDLSITGSVAEVDTVGTVSQGVVSYNVKINFDTDEEKIKQGMSVSASIITDVKQNVLMVPNSAIKSQDDINYVEIFDKEIATAQISSSEIPKQQIVEIGLSNDTSTEIISGLSENQKVISRTTTASSSSTSKTTTSNNLLRSGGGEFRMAR
jgi:HlyD family secretion protein